MISELNSHACVPPVNASPHSYEIPTHDSVSRLVANHYRVGTFTRYPLPAFTGAFGANLVFARILLVTICTVISLDLGEHEVRPYVEEEIRKTAGQDVGLRLTANPTY